MKFNATPPPKSWEEIRLADCFEMVLGGDWGKGPDELLPEFELALCIRSSELKAWQTEKGKSAALRRILKSSIGKRQLRYGDLLIEVSGGGPEQPVGRVVMIDQQVLAQSPELPKVCTNFFRMARPSQELAPAFLTMYLQHFYALGKTTPLQAGSNNLRNLKFPDFLAVNIPLPPFNEQQRIVAKIEELFSELDKGVESLKLARTQLETYRQTVMKQAFEGKLTTDWRAANAENLEPPESLLDRVKKEREACYNQHLSKWVISTLKWEKQRRKGKRPVKPKRQKNTTSPTEEDLIEFSPLPTSWKWVKLGELVWSVKDGPHFSPKYAEVGIPFISGGNIRPTGVDFSKTKFITPELHDELSERCKPEKGDILYTKGGTTGIARVNTYEIDFNVWVHVAVLKLTISMNPFYLQHALNSPKSYIQSQKYTHGVGNQDLGLTRMVNIILPLCDCAEQDRVVEICDRLLSVFDEIINTIETELERAHLIGQSILKKAFSGQLVQQDAADEPASELLARIRTTAALSKRKKTA